MARGRTPGSLPPPPRFLADPWGWVTLLSVLPLALRMAGSPFGEPVAEDFDFLYRALLQGMGSLLDGGGSQAFWRPIPHQLYYAGLGRLLVSSPGTVAALHLVLLAVAAVLVYRALRPSWSGPLAAAAASFPLLAESTRTIAGWPTQFVDLGLYLFTALAVHETTRKRLPTALGALLAALLCKEVAVVTAVLLPFTPAGPRGRAERMRWAAGTGAVVAAWALASLAVRRHAHLVLPPNLTHSSEALATPFAARLAWALGGCAKAMFSLPLRAGPHDAPVLLVLLALVGGAGVLFATSRAARARFAGQGPWLAWGCAWFLLATASLTTVFPSWQPNRSQYGSVGLGIAAVAGLGAAHPVCASLLVGLRLASLALAPGAVVTIEEKAPDTGAFMDYARLTRLQRFMRDTRLLLRRRYPTLPHGAIIVQENLPHSLEYAFGGSHALRVWYADSTLNWMRFETFRQHLDTAVTVLVQGAPGHVPDVALVSPDAMRGLLRARALLASQRFPEILALLDHADSSQSDTNAIAYRVASGSWRAYVYASTGRAVEGERIAARLLALEPGDVLTRQVYALSVAEQGRFDEAYAQIDSLVRRAPRNTATPTLRVHIDELREAAERATRPRPPAAPPAR